jgi:hypothetical protein
MSVSTNIRMNRRTARRQQGAAMLAVMLILLVATATAAVSVQSTNFELRAAGYNRRATQNKLIAEAGLAAAISVVDSVGVNNLLREMNQLERLAVKDMEDPAYQCGSAANGSSFIPDATEFNEPCCQPPFEVCDRFELADFDANHPPVSADALGPGQPYQPWFSVDIKLEEDSAGTRPGYAVGKRGSMKFVHVTYTARGGTVLAGGGANPRRAIRTACASMTLGPVHSL